MRKIAWLLVTMLLLTACSAEASRGTIFRYVEDHQQELEQRVEARNFEGMGIPGLEVHVRETCVEFAWGASGFGSETSYWGFFWSEDGDPLVLWSGLREDDFVPEGEGFLWMQPDGDNICYVEHICGHFYYYEEHF